jgi:predicted enzyme related to lactoylglutathione lyase
MTWLEAKAFYKAVFGWDAETQGPEGPGGYTEWKVGGRSIGGMMPSRPDAGRHPVLLGRLLCGGRHRCLGAKAQELGASVMMPATDIEPGRFAVLADPVGAMFNILALKPELQT